MSTKETRREAYDGVLPKRENRCRLILETIGARAMTVSEILDALVDAGQLKYYDRNFVAPRVTELRDMGILAPAGKRRCARTDRQETVWRRTDAPQRSAECWDGGQLLLGAGEVDA